MVIIMKGEGIKKVNMRVNLIFIISVYILKAFNYGVCAWKWTASSKLYIEMIFKLKEVFFL